MSSCPAPVSIAAHKTLVEAARLEKQNEFDKAFQVTIHTANGIDPNCRMRAALEIDAAAIEFRAGALTQAEQLSTKALKELRRFEDESADVGMAEYIIGSVLEVRGRIADAERQYLKAVYALTALGDHRALRLARVYSDLAVINIRRNNTRQAEIYLQKSIDLEKTVKMTDPIERLARQDAVVHLAYKKGNTSEAIRLNALLIKGYGEDMDIPAGLRAHIFADRGGLMYSIGRYNESLVNLNSSLDLYRSSAGDPETIAVTSTMLARARIALHDMVGAQENLEEAVQLSRKLRANYPLYVAFIEESYGEYLAANRQWSKARAQYLDSISLMNAAAGAKQELSECLLEAARADDHLDQKKESKKFRKQAQSLIAESRTPGGGSTVDLTTLEASAQRR
ncbi:MAG TPA: tetratricopeptide repeat protein [Bryobacteraceae bacterium]|nr:tetratricopeptide repeat protein [Bryobacteraceae bacterium]